MVHALVTVESCNKTSTARIEEWLRLACSRKGSWRLRYIPKTLRQSAWERADWRPGQ